MYDTLAFWAFLKIRDNTGVCSYSILLNAYLIFIKVRNPGYLLAVINHKVNFD